MSVKEHKTLNVYDRLEESKTSTPSPEDPAPAVADMQGLKKRSLIRAYMWTKMHTSVPEVMRRSRLSQRSSYSHASQVQHHDHRKISESVQYQFPRETSQELLNQLHLSFFNLNELPYMSQMRSLLLIVCASSFITAPLAYMPLGGIQAAYDQRCFLYTRVRVRRLVLEGNTSYYSTILLDTVATEWGPVSTCDFTTFVPVSVSIFSIIVGVSTFTIWPTMMSLGRGGALMMTYAFLSLMSLIACMTCSLFIRLGYSDTCRKMIEETQKFREDGLRCNNLNNIQIHVQEVEDSFLTNNIHRAMMLAEIISWCLVGLSLSEFLICILTFGIIWFYLNS